MPVNDNYEIQEYYGNSSGRIFNFPFRCFSLEHLVVELLGADGSVTTLLQNTDYAVSGGLDNAGGMVTYPLASELPPLCPSERLRIYRVTPLEQPIDYPSYQQTIENALDKTTMLLQEAVNESAVVIANEAVETVNAAVGSVNEAVAAIADKVDGDGTGITDRLAFLAKLGISTGGEVELSDVAYTSGGNIDVAAYRSLLGLSAIEEDVADYTAQASSVGSTVTAIDSRVTALEDTPVAVKPQTIVAGATGELPDGWIIADVDLPTAHMFFGNTLSAGYKGLLPVFDKETMPGWGTVVSTEYSNSAYMNYFALTKESDFFWVSPNIENPTFVYDGALQAGTINAYSFTCRICDSNDLLYVPSAWTLEDQDGNVLDSQIGITNWTSGETKLFTLSSFVDTSTITQLKFTFTDNNTSSYYYVSIGCICFLESIDTDYVVDINSGLQVAAGAKGKVYVSDALDGNVTLDISDIINANNGIGYIYSDIGSDGIQSFGYTDIEPQIGLQKNNYLDFVPTLSANSTEDYNVSMSSVYSASTSAYLAYNDDTSQDVAAITADSSYPARTGNESMFIELKSGESFITNGIKIMPYTNTSSLYGCPVDFTIDGSDDNGNTWANILTKTSVTNWEVQKYLSFNWNAVTFKKLRINCTLVSGASYFAVSELQWLKPFEGDFYNTANHTHYDKDGNIRKRVYIGEFYGVNGAVDSVVNYQQGTVCTLPVNAGDNIVINSKYYLARPYLGDCGSQVRIYHENKWGDPGWLYSAEGYGVKANMTDGVLSVQSGTSYLTAPGAQIGGEFSLATNQPKRAKATVIRQW